MANQNSGDRLRIPTWLLSILTVAALGAVGTAASTLANANTDHNEIIPQQQREISSLFKAVNQMQSDMAATKTDAAATRAMTADTNAKVNLLLAAQLQGR